MPKNQRVERRPDLGRVKPQPVFAQVPKTERRNVATRHALVRRVHNEYREMPGLRLTLEQAARLFHLPGETCARVLGELIEEGVLRRTRNGFYVLAQAGF